MSVLVLDHFIPEFDCALRAAVGVARTSRPNPADAVIAFTASANTADNTARLSETDRRHAASPVRVNHAGEVCAQTLYQERALFAQSPIIRAWLDEAVHEEEGHLIWRVQCLQELNDRPNLLNPPWYAGAFATGALAGCLDDEIDLGSVAEAERQVEHHLGGYLSKLPKQDTCSCATVIQMREGETRHGDNVCQVDGIDLPAPIRQAMRTVSRVMTATVYRIRRTCRTWRSDDKLHASPFAGT